MRIGTWYTLLGIAGLIMTAAIGSGFPAFIRGVGYAIVVCVIMAHLATTEIRTTTTYYVERKAKR